MKYQANPVIVDAFKITKVCEPIIDQGIPLHLENGGEVIATPAMTSRMIPAVGDYWVRQADDYIYLNPKHVFEKKYSEIPE